MPTQSLNLKAIFAAVAVMLLGMTMLLAEPGGRFDLMKFTRVDKSTVSVSARGGGGGKKTTATPVYPELTLIKSNFDVTTELVPAWGTGALPASAAPATGSFMILCSAGQLLQDDPLEMQNQPGAAPLNQFVGNTAATASSNYTSLRGGGDSSCMSPVDRSSSWFPAMLDGVGNAVRPDYIVMTYSRLAATNIACTTSGAKGCIPLPNGLRYTIGYNNLTPSATPTGGFYFTCDGPGAVAGHYADIVAAAPNCPTGSRLGAIINSPSCWDGVNLDSSGHRDHVAYQQVNWLGQASCPSTHPYIIPSFKMAVWYSTDANLDRSGKWDTSTTTWHFSSDSKAGTTPVTPGSTFRVGWWGAWDNGVQSMWLDNCINKVLLCAAGDLGNGKQVRQSYPFAYNANPRLVTQGGTSTPPAPTPTPTPVPSGTAITTLADDGDSISVFWGGNWTGIYAATRPTITFKPFAVGGSGFAQMDSRWPQVSASGAGAVIAFIGANDAYDLTQFPTAQDYANAIFRYADRAHAAGMKVVWGTIIAQASTYPPASYTNGFEVRRREINALLRAAVGTHIDALIPFDSDPRLGTLAGARDTTIYQDGVHPTGGYEIMAAIAKPYIDAVANGTAIPAVPAAAAPTP